MMKLGLLTLALVLTAPLIWMMSKGGLAAGSFGHSFGVSNAIWLALLHMGMFVALCGVILAVDRPDSPR